MTVVCIAGMHRSGTSMIARMLNLCGIYLGDEKDIIPEAIDNSEGYWENLRFVNLNEKVLLGLKGGWDIPPVVEPGWENLPLTISYQKEAEQLVEYMNVHSTWGWKDPRNSLTLPFWRKLIPDLKVIVCVRDPDEIAQSLAHRGYSSYTFSVNLWFTYYQRLLASVSEEDRIVTHYDSFFYDGRSELNRLLSFLQIRGDDRKINVACTVVNLAMKHNQGAGTDLKGLKDYPEVMDLYSYLCSQAGPIFQAVSETHTDGTANKLSSTENLRTEEVNPERLIQNLRWRLMQKLHIIENLEQQLDSNKQIVQSLKQQLHHHEVNTQSLTTRLNEIYSSKGWKILQNILAVRLAIIPRNSLRENFLRFLLKRRWTDPGGLARSKKAGPDGAISDYDEADRFKVDYAEAYYNRGRARRDKGDLDEAITDYTEAIYLKPDNPDYYLGRGNLLSTKGDNINALPDFQNASNLRPEDGSIRASLARVLKSLGRIEESNEQEEIARGLIQTEDEYDQACFESICGNTDKALKLLKIGLEKNQATKERARQDPDLENIREDPGFKELVGE